MLWVVLGAPGSGKSTVAARLRTAVPQLAVIDWDEFMPPVERLVGREVRQSPELWQPYAELVEVVVRSLGGVPAVLFTVCTPDELREWPTSEWTLLDCDDVERERRLAGRRPEEIRHALNDASAYRRLGLPVLDTSSKAVDEVVAELVLRLR